MIMCGIKVPVDAKFYRPNVRLRRAQRSVPLPTLGRLPTAAAGGCGLAALVGRMLVNAAHTHDSTQGSGRLVIRAA